MFEYHLADDSTQPGGNADLDCSAFSLLRVPGNILGVAGLHDEFSRFFQKGMTSLGELNFALVAHKEGNTKIFLQLADLATERRLGNVQLLCRLPEVEVLGDRNKVPYVTQFHGDEFYTR